MPYKRTRRKRRPRRRMGKKGLVKVIKQVTQRVAEKHYKLSKSGGGVAVDATGTVTCISQIPQGDSDETRSADQLYLRSIWFKWDAVNADTYNYVRLIVFQWFPQVTDTAGSPPAIADNILFDGGTDTENYNMPYYHDSRYMFKVLYDKTVNVNTYNPNSRSHQVLITSGFKRKLQYFSGSATNGMNQIFALKISDSTASPHTTMNSAFKLNFTDM